FLEHCNVLPTDSTLKQLYMKKVFASGNNARVHILVSSVKKAELSARRKDRIKLPIYPDASGGRTYHISEFLSHPSGVEAILNTNAMDDLQPLDTNRYRVWWIPHIAYQERSALQCGLLLSHNNAMGPLCILPQVQLLQFEVAPVLDLKVTPTREDCMVEMLSCKVSFLPLLETSRK
ncbi:hypothetical protein RJ641_006340, partial [Dillenia turbinata]